jgi:hypothetical protein
LNNEETSLILPYVPEHLLTRFIAAKQLITPKTRLSQFFSLPKLEDFFSLGDVLKRSEFLDALELTTEQRAQYVILDARPRCSGTPSIFAMLTLDPKQKRSLLDKIIEAEVEVPSFQELQLENFELRQALLEVCWA